MKEKNYRTVTESETAKEFDIVNICNADDILYDIKYLIKDFYIACFDKTENGLIIRLSNGQVFGLNVYDLTESPADKIM